MQKRSSSTLSFSMNKYERKPEFVLDLHGQTTKQAKVLLDQLLSSGKYKHVRIITGKATFRETGPILKNYVSGYLKDLGLEFQTAKLTNGGDGALEVYL